MQEADADNDILCNTPSLWLFPVPVVLRNKRLATGPMRALSTA